jgi:integrase
MQDKPTRGDRLQRVPVPGHPGIYTRGGSYAVAFRERGRLRTRQFRTLSEARRFTGRAASGETRPDSREAFNRYAERWLASYRGRTAKGLTAGTRESYCDAIKRLAVPFFGTVRLEHIDAPLLGDYIAHLTKKRMAPATVRRYFAVMRALLATAVAEGLLAHNPATGVRVIVRDRRPAVPARLTPEQTQALLAAMPAAHRDLAWVLAATGLRISEALGARWGDLGTAPGGGPVLRVVRESTKTDAGARLIPLTPDTARMLTRRRSEARYAADGDPIFPSDAGTPMDARSYRKRVFNPARKAAGVPWATPHKLRHGLASLMAERGYSAAQIAAQLGHADGGALALRVYVHPSLHAAPDVGDVLAEGGNVGGNTPAESGRI